MHTGGVGVIAAEVTLNDVPIGLGVLQLADDLLAVHGAGIVGVDHDVDLAAVQAFVLLGHFLPADLRAVKVEHDVDGAASLLDGGGVGHIVGIVSVTKLADVQGLGTDVFAVACVAAGVTGIVVAAGGRAVAGTANAQQHHGCQQTCDQISCFHSVTSFLLLLGVDVCTNVNIRLQNAAVR